jgi:hypothetical protein
MPARTPVVLGGGVPTTGLLEAADQRLVVRLEVEHPDVGLAALELVDRVDQRREELPAADVGDERELADRRPRRERQLHDPSDQRRRQVVDHEPAEVLEHVGRGRAARPPTSP